MNRLVYYIPAGLFVLLVGYFIVGLTLEPGKLDSVLIDQPLESFLLEPIEGFDEGFSKADLEGKVSLINVFGSWCVGCQIEHPQLMQIAAEGEVPIFGVNWREKPGDGAAWLARHGNPYTKIGDDPDSRMAIRLGVTGAPETFLIDRAGNIRFKFAGPIDEVIWRREFLPRIEELKQQ